MGLNCNVAVKNCHPAQEKGRHEWYCVQGEDTYQCFDIKRYMNKDKSHTVGGGRHTLPGQRRRGGTNGGRAGKMKVFKA